MMQSLIVNLLLLAIITGILGFHFGRKYGTKTENRRWIAMMTKEIHAPLQPLPRNHWRTFEGVERLANMCAEKRSHPPRPVSIPGTGKEGVE